MAILQIRQFPRQYQNYESFRIVIRLARDDLGMAFIPPNKRPAGADDALAGNVVPDLVCIDPLLTRTLGKTSLNRYEISLRVLGHSVAFSFIGGHGCFSGFLCR
jgi:hypothetical protein